MNIHAPVPSLLDHVCVCGKRDSDPTWHRTPVATVSPLRGEASRNATATTLPKAVARRTDPSTSWEAARSVTALTEKQGEVLLVFERYGPFTDEDGWAVYSKVGDVKMSVSGFRTRRSELVARGLLRDTGERRRGSTGRRMIVWAAA